MTDRVTAPYGAWPSPIAASDVARGVRRLGFPSVAGDEVWWEEARPDEGGRTTVMRRGADGADTELLAAPWSANTRVHEYGGRSHLPVPRRDDKARTRYGIVFSNAADQRLYLLERDSRTPVPLTPEPDAPAALRYADPALSADGKRVVCVREEHGADGSVRRAIVAVPLSGRAAEDPGAVSVLVTGADFFASPTPSPDGEHLAWVAWNHPRMPWDGTELRVGRLGPDGVTGAYTLKGGVSESVLHPVWNGASRICFVSDWPGFWNLYEIGLTGQAIALYPDESEFTPGPARLGTLPYVRLDDGRLVVLHGGADLAPAVYDPQTLELTPLDTPFTSWETLGGDGRRVVGLASGPRTPQSLVLLDPDTGRVRTLRASLDDLPDPGYLPEPETVELPGRYGGTVHANLYRPANPEASADGPAPYAVWVHGGPVARATTALDLAKAYFTSRGIGVVDVNYSGSIGFGRTYRERLHGMWGVLDVEDAEAVARALAADGTADPDRIAVRGGSAGGFTTLLAATGDAFACGTSLYGVTDLLRLAAETHDFESRFLDSLIGPLPGYSATYRERSPINRADRVRVPLLLLQGTEDRVVPRAQASEFAAALAEGGIRHALIEFEGEGHGFRGAEAVQRALEAELAFYGEVFGFTPPGVPPVELVTEYPDPELEAEPLPELDEDAVAAPTAEEAERPAAPGTAGKPAAASAPGPEPIWPGSAPSGAEKG
ncbi:S9 family peptidase [Nocardiopsis composta]|uniref:Dipeptidyl aminopeptidase/acylaminoacyl peptidase n=1 Tax=Nocardiopsis composta TaxID=157465 RepID=A0A7W8QMI3_9ACTN|nr:prolyl oligopeptidase family serine peptidase [Nocardiopsis composta]MBB5432186.1 dipeptidyl aminopeptidase/acylaminoacyl peptidase [Nocardiopsis composta]